MTESRVRAMLELAEKLGRFIAMPEWPRFYMDKEQAALCAAALRARAADTPKVTSDDR